MDEQAVRAAAEDGAALKRRFGIEKAELVVAVGNRMAAALRAGGKVLTFGNGGSAADAQHLAAELVGLTALDKAREMGMVTVAMTGQAGGVLAGRVDYLIDVPHSSTPRIQEVHAFVVHLLCQVVEEAIAG
jgi:phosphoheptose isomerase